MCINGHRTRPVPQCMIISIILLHINNISTGSSASYVRSESGDSRAQLIPVRNRKRNWHIQSLNLTLWMTRSDDEYHAANLVATSGQPAEHHGLDLKMACRLEKARDGCDGADRHSPMPESLRSFNLRLPYLKNGSLDFLFIIVFSWPLGAHLVKLSPKMFLLKIQIFSTIFHVITVTFWREKRSSFSSFQEGKTANTSVFSFLFLPPTGRSRTSRLE